MVLTLERAKSRRLEISISSPDGYEETVFIGTLSYTEWNNCAIGVEFPAVPTLRMLTDKGNQDVFNYNDPTYRNALTAAESQVTFRRVVSTLIKGGNFPELANKPLEAQCAELEELDFTIVQGVAQALFQLQRHTKGGVEAQKAAFPNKSLPTNPQEHSQEEELVTG
jgi:hypothetical protein